MVSPLSSCSLSVGFLELLKNLLANPVDYEKKKKKKKTKEERGRLATEFCVKQENLKQGSGRRRDEEEGTVTSSKMTMGRH